MFLEIDIYTELWLFAAAVQFFTYHCLLLYDTWILIDFTNMSSCGQFSGISGYLLTICDQDLCLFNIIV